MAGISQHKAASYFEHYIVMAMESAGVKVTGDMRTELAEAVAAFEAQMVQSLDDQLAALLADPNSRASKSLYANSGRIQSAPQR